MSKPRVLVVDDSEVGRTLLLSQLSHLGYEAEAADNGVKAVDKVMQGDFSLVLMDIFMPGIDGIEATRQIREYQTQQGKSRIPIVAVTGGADRQACIAGGLDDFVSKPIMLDDLRRVITQWLTPMNTPK
ncbi:MAG TPA: response regulator [Planktothrix sp.]|jgi:CheY-like chemotaxis protein